MPIGEMWNLEELSQKCKDLSRHSEYWSLCVILELIVSAQPSSLRARHYMSRVGLEALREQLRSSRLSSRQLYLMIAAKEQVTPDIFILLRSDVSAKLSEVVILFVHYSISC